MITSPEGAVAKYCDDYVCLCICLSVREDISGTTRAIFTNFCACCLCPWLGPPLTCLYDRPYRLSPGRCFIPHWECIIGRKKGMGVHSAGEVCYVRLPCFSLKECWRSPSIA